MFVLHMVRAVGTPVDTVVGQIQRCKEHNAVAVEILLDLLGKTEDLLVHFIVLTGEKDGCLPVG